MVGKTTVRMKNRGPAVLGFAVFLAGCGMVPVLPPPKYVHPAMQYVIDNKAQFAVDLDDPLFDLDPGAVIDDLSKLDGCWGAALLSDVTVNGTPLVSFYLVHVFDSETGEHTGWILQEDAFGFLTVAGGQSGTFSVVEENRLATEGRRQTGYFPTSFEEPLTFEWVDDEEIFEPHTSESLATLSGDRLRIHYGDADRDPVDPGDDTIYVRFDCPE